MFAHPADATVDLPRGECATPRLRAREWRRYCGAANSGSRRKRECDDLVDRRGFVGPVPVLAKAKLLATVRPEEKISAITWVRTSDRAPIPGYFAATLSEF